MAGMIADRLIMIVQEETGGRTVAPTTARTVVVPHLNKTVAGPMSVWNPVVVEIVVPPTMNAVRTVVVVEAEEGARVSFDDAMLGFPAGTVGVTHPATLSLIFLFLTLYFTHPL